MWLIIGAGVSGKSAFDLLLTQGKEAAIVEDNDISTKIQTAYPILSTIDAIALIHSIEAVIISPGVPPTHKVLLQCTALDIPVFSEIEYARQFCQGTFIGITGTNGKSTATTMAEHILKSLGRKVHIAGNIGIPLSSYASKKNHPEFYILELSSYQLEQSNSLELDYSIFYNLGSDHLERHGSVKNYHQAKFRLISQTKKTALLSTNVHALISRDQKNNKQKIICKDPQKNSGFMRSAQSILPLHDAINAFYVCETLSEVLHVSSFELLQYLKTYQSLSHRFEPLKTPSPYTIINDSKSTNVAATLAALESAPKPLVLLMGGQGKGESFRPLLPLMKNVIAIKAFGPEANHIYQTFKLIVPCERYATLSKLLLTYQNESHRIESNILFSPGCASFDEFKDFEERGRFFSQSIVSTLTHASVPNKLT